MHARLLLPIALFYALLCATATSSLAQVGQWVSWGPPGGFIRSVAVDAVDPETLYAGTDAALFRSSDGGVTWEWSSRNLGSPIEGIWTAAGGNPSTVYVVANGDLYRSRRQGQAWRQVFDRSNAHARELAVSTNYSDQLFLRTDVGLYQSRDRGNSWQRVGGGLPGELELFEIAADPVYPERFFLLTGEPTTGNRRTANRLWQTPDSGATWDEIFVGENLSRMAAGAPRVAGESPALYIGSDSRDLHRSFDGGMSWETLPGSLTEFEPLAWLRGDPRRPGVLFASFFRTNRLFLSTDQGATWSTPTQKVWPANAIAFDPHSPRAVHLAAGLRGFGTSPDGGPTWTIDDAGIPALHLSAIAPDPRDEDTALVLGDGCLLETSDRGASWEAIPERCLDQPGLSGLMRDPEDPDLLWAADFEGIVRSTDGGQTWRQRDGTVAGGPPRVFQIVDDPRGQRRLWLLTDEGLFRYTDAQATWVWIQIRPGDSPGRGPILQGFAIDPEDPEVLWATQSTALFHSADGGTSWTTGGPELANGETFGAIRIDPRHPERMYVLTERRVWRSLDRGTSWESWREGLPGGRRLHDLEIDPGTGALYVGLSQFDGPAGGGIFRRAIDGPEWRPIGRFKDNVGQLVVERRGGRALIWAGTEGRSLFRLERQR